MATRSRNLRPTRFDSTRRNQVPATQTASPTTATRTRPLSFLVIPSTSSLSHNASSASGSIIARASDNERARSRGSAR